MGIYDKYYKFICRVCLSHRSNEEMVCLTDKNSEDGLSYYGKAVEQFANVSIKMNDELPQSMCQNCLMMLNQAIQFKSQCEQSDIYLSKLYIQHIEFDSNLKEIVVDFSLFRHSNPQEFLHITSSTDIEIELEYKNDDIDKKSTENEQLSYENNDCMTSIEDESNSNSDNKTFSQLKKEDLCNTNLLENNYNASSEVEVKPNNHKIIILSQKKIQEAYQHTNKNTKTEKYVCEICQAVLGSQTTYKMHMHRHNGFVPQEKSKKKKSSPRKPKRRFTPKKEAQKGAEKFVCEVCSKVLMTPLTLKYHMQYHNGFNHICEQCGRGFTLLGKLEKHRFVVHGTGKFYQCPHCPHKAPTNFCLKEHVRIHTGERPHVCDKCGLTFRQLYLYNRHKFYHKDKRFQCPHCPKKFHTSAEVREHSNSKHERVFMYLCPECHKTCTRLTGVRRHLKNIHGIPREKQGKIKKISVKGKGTSDIEIPITTFD